MKITSLLMFFCLYIGQLSAQTVDERVKAINDGLTNSEAYLKYEPIGRLFFFEKMSQRPILSMKATSESLEFYAEDQYYTIYLDSIVSIDKKLKSVLIDVGCGKKGELCKKIKADIVKIEGEWLRLPPRPLGSFQLYFGKSADKKQFYNRLIDLIDTLKQ